MCVCITSCADRLLWKNIHRMKRICCCYTTTTINSSVARIYYHSVFASIAQSSGVRIALNLLFCRSRTFLAPSFQAASAHFYPPSSSHILINFSLNTQFKEYTEMLLCVRLFPFSTFLFISVLFFVKADQLLTLIIVFSLQSGCYH